MGFDAVWNDDLHHTLHRLLTGEKDRYYADYDGLEDLRCALTEAFVLSGGYSTFRRRRHGAPAIDLPPDRFVVGTQNHDQVGNRGLGERLAALVPFEAVKLAAGIVLLSPFVPLVFMGEEYGETAPFLYFTSHTDADLAEAVRRGRRAEFSLSESATEVPDPQSEGTFQRSRIHFEQRLAPPHRHVWDLYRDLLRFRTDHLRSRQAGPGRGIGPLAGGPRRSPEGRGERRERGALRSRCFGGEGTGPGLGSPMGTGPCIGGRATGRPRDGAARDDPGGSVPRGYPSGALLCPVPSERTHEVIRWDTYASMAISTSPPGRTPGWRRSRSRTRRHRHHDWNDRITVECYRPNDSARIVDGEGFITEIVNNYSRISFNFGPTLLSWLEYKAPDVYHALQEADHKSLEHYSGHGSALAQAYNHLIMPLANRRDKETQVIWGIRDFEHRFGRQPEGMWLPETAVDDETLNVLAEQGIKFTILAPYQAGAVRDIGSKDWSPTPDGSVDTTQAYRVPLAENRTIVVFFYDGSPSHDIAFGNLLSNGGDFARRLVARLQNVPPMEPLLSHIATDGETYGHHQKHGEMALAFALRTIEADKLATLTNYGEFLALHPPKKEAQVVPNTSWSCAHGIERWRSNCGCNAGRGPGWQQEWRGPLRAALDWLRDSINPKFEQAAGELLKDPWKARNDYIGVVLDRSPANEDAFFAEHAGRALSPEETTRALQLLELERQLLLMYTSCGWFFDDIGGIETVQDPGVRGAGGPARGDALLRVLRGRVQGTSGRRPGERPREREREPDLRQARTAEPDRSPERLCPLRAELALRIVRGPRERLLLPRREAGPSDANGRRGAARRRPGGRDLRGDARKWPVLVRRPLHRRFEPLRGRPPLPRRRGLCQHGQRAHRIVRPGGCSRDDPTGGPSFRGRDVHAPAPVPGRAAEDRGPHARPDPGHGAGRLSADLRDHGAAPPQPGRGGLARSLRAPERDRVLSQPPHPHGLGAGRSRPQRGRRVDRRARADAPQPRDRVRRVRLGARRGAPHGAVRDRPRGPRPPPAAQRDGPVPAEPSHLGRPLRRYRTAASASCKRSIPLAGRRPRRGTPRPRNGSRASRRSRSISRSGSRRPVRVPLATYRVQVHRGFDLKAVRRIVPYIRGLGIDTVYLSPIVRSRRGSTHGYDVVDPNALDPDRGSPADLRSLVLTLRANRMGLLLDIVPNHMAASLENPWWKDVLTFGRSSRFARVFDIDWGVGAWPNGRVALPLLSHDVRSSFASAELTFEVSTKGLFLRCQAQRLPLAPGSIVRWLEAAEEQAARDRRDPTDRERLGKWAARGRRPCPDLGGDLPRTRRDGPSSIESSFRTYVPHLRCDVGSERLPKK